MMRIENDEGDDVIVPCKWEICGWCRGNGRHVHDALSVWTESDRAEDPDGFEDMMNGAYDVRCEECTGTGKVEVPDFENMDEETAKTVREHLNMLADLEAEQASERRYGA